MRKTNKKTLSIIVPCYNEEKNVTLLYNEFVGVLKMRDLNVEMIFINDGSKDNTYKELVKLTDKKEFVVEVINFSRNFGKEAAMYAGLKKSTGDYVLIIDADLQQEPKLVLKMLDTLEEYDDYDSVCYFQEKRIENEFISFLKSNFYKFISSISDVEFVDGASDFRLFRRYMVDAILELTERNRFSKGIFSWVGFNTCYLPYTPKDRKYGESSFNFRKLLMYALSGIISFSVVPLRIATYGGLVFALLSLLYLVVVIIQKIFFTINVPGYPTLIVTILFIGGLILFCLGIIGEYIGRIYMETKKRPIYLEKNSVSNRKKTK